MHGSAPPDSFTCTILVGGYSWVILTEPLLYTCTYWVKYMTICNSCCNLSLAKLLGNQLLAYLLLVVV